MNGELCGQPRLHPSVDSEDPRKTHCRVASSKIGRLRCLSTNPCPSQVEDHPWVFSSPALPHSPQAPEKSPRQGGMGHGQLRRLLSLWMGTSSCRCKWTLRWAEGHTAGQQHFLIHGEPSHSLSFHTELFAVTHPLALQQSGPLLKTPPSDWEPPTQTLGLNSA